jgi:hypothetical protein
MCVRLYAIERLEIASIMLTSELPIFIDGLRPCLPLSLAGNWFLTPCHRSLRGGNEPSLTAQSVVLVGGAGM